MVKKKKTKTASQKKKSPIKTETWVDKLDFVPIDDDYTKQTPRSTDDSNATTRIRIVSWNILAESYLTRRSHRELPRLYQNCVFSPRARRAVLHKRLRHFCELNVDILCLQEVDMPLEVLKECGYDSILTPTAREGNGTGGRVDACGIYFQRDKWKSCGHELIRLDDLATLGQTGTMLPISNLQGLSTSFLRRNVALVCRLQHVESNKKIVVANAHCYWNPEYSYVKLCQVHYVVKRAHEFCKEGEGVVFCGDLNSPPHSSVYEYLSKGKVNAKLVAPWYQHSIEQEEKGFVPEEIDIHQVQDELAGLSIAAKEEEKENDESPQIRYMLDFTLNRFTRWLRILGIDAALETEEEEIQRTRENNMYVIPVLCLCANHADTLCLACVRRACIVALSNDTYHSHALCTLLFVRVLFERCRKERRTLVTTSYKLLLRKDCPSGTYLVNPKSQSKLGSCLCSFAASSWRYVGTSQLFITLCSVQWLYHGCEAH